ncbi:MAG: sulfide:quinone oxidoreductase [Gammaproteobacteria bacterium]
MQTLEIKRIDEEISVAPQILASDLSAIADAGFSTVICNRPDGEGEDQQAFAEIEAAAQAAGISIMFQPVQSGNVTDQDVVQFGRLLDNAAKPVLAYCRTGTRCTMLWCLSRSGKMPVNDILARASAAGYDMSGIVARF